MGKLDELLGGPKTETPAPAKTPSTAAPAAATPAPASGGFLNALSALGDAKKVNPPPAETKAEAPTPPAEPAKEKPTTKTKAKEKPATTTPHVSRDLVALLDCAYEKNGTGMAGVMTLADALREAGASHDDAAKKLDEWLSSNDVTGVIVADTHTPLGCECSDVLRLHARTVIRGTR